MACNWIRPAAFHTQTQRQKSDTMQAWVYFDASLRVPAHCARVSTPYLVCQMPGESSPASPHRKRSWRGRLWDDFLRNSSGLNLATANETQVGHALPLRSSCSTATLLLWTGSGPWLHIGCKCGPCASNRRSSWTSPPLRETRQTFQLSFDYRLHSWSIVRPKPKLRHSASSFWSKNAPETPRHVRHEPKNSVSFTVTWSHSSLSGEGAQPKKARKSEESAQGRTEGEHTPRGQLHVGCAVPLICAEIGFCWYLSGSVSPNSCEVSFCCFEGQKEAGVGPGARPPEETGGLRQKKGRPRNHFGVFWGYPYFRKPPYSSASSFVKFPKKPPRRTFCR